MSEIAQLLAQPMHHETKRRTQAKLTRISHDLTALRQLVSAQDANENDALLTQASRQFLLSESEGVSNLELVIGALTAKAAGGDVKAAQLLFDRAFGPVARGGEHSKFADTINLLVSQLDASSIGTRGGVRDGTRTPPPIDRPPASNETHLTDPVLNTPKSEGTSTIIDAEYSDSTLSDL